MPRHVLLLLASLGLVPAPTGRAQTSTTTIHACGRPASVDIWARNETDLPAVTLDVDGSLDAAAVTCGGAPDLRTSYAATVVCAGSGLVRCTDQQGVPARLDGLQPGTWVHRMAATGDPPSDPQRQAQRGIVVAGSDATDTVTWTVYGFTRAVTTDDPSDLRAAVWATTQWAAAHAGRHALVTLRPPGPITFADQESCAPDATCDPTLTSPKAGICLPGDRIVLDGYDDNGRRAAELRAGTTVQPVVRVYGRDVELRGLTLVGSTRSNTQADTLSFMSPARRSALVDSTVIGPAKGDGISSCGGGSDVDANLVVDSELRGAEDKGVKVTGGGVQVVSGSCVADNANGGIQATLGGRVIARENVVQHNVPAGAENGIFANDSAGVPSSVTTRGNIVRFSGERGVSVVDNAIADFHDDYIARNQYTGARVETTRPGVPPQASFSGVAFVCNKVAFVAANCRRNDCNDEDPCPSGAACIDDSDCAENERCTTTFPLGVGLGIQFPQDLRGPCLCASPPCPCAAPSVALANVAMTRNDGANLQLNVPGATLAAGGTQWEGCGSSACDEAAEDSVRSLNVREAIGAHVDLLPIVPSTAGTASLTGVSPARPRAGQLVRVYGTGFDAINGNALPTACQKPPARDADFCDPSEPALAQLNRGSAGNRLRLFMGGQTWVLDVAAVTPTMLAFRMPVDCFAPASIELRRGPPPALRITVCAAESCAGQPAAVACADDGNACTDDVCDGGGTCTHPPLPAGTACREAAGPCDLAEVCDGTGEPCPSDAKHPAGRVCRSAAGPCDRPETCSGTGDACPDDQLREPTRICRAATGPCDVVEACDGTTAACPPNVWRPAGDVCRATAGPCDVPEVCDGRDATCPDDVLRPAGNVCRAAAGVCDVAEACDGGSAACPDDAKRPADAVCRGAAGACDVAERCDGRTDACPPDALEVAGTVCRTAQDACDLIETCSGTATACPADAGATGLDAVACELAELERMIEQACRRGRIDRARREA